MIVFGDREQRVSTRDFLASIERTSDETERLIRYGQLEAAAMDALCPAYDGETALAIPEELTIKTPEGFAYYSVYPQQYHDATLRFVRECQPQSAVVIGIRSIGAPLSLVVANAVGCPVWRFTVRPHGHPYDRQLRLSDALAERIRQHADRWFLIVDEGPGRSGSSFVSVADALMELGVPEDRIVLFPSHEPDPGTLVSERARVLWPRLRRYVEPFESLQVIPSGALDLSGGQWRQLVFDDCKDWPDVVTMFERRKYLADGTLWKFAGLAHLGSAKLKRAEALEGFIPEPIGFENGFLLTRWLEGEPVRYADEELLRTVRRYLEHLERTFPTNEPVRYRELWEMIRVNTGIVMPERLPEIEEAPVIAGDGRMLPHEWIRTPDGYRKTDALDHHDDHFFPGRQPIDWDIAGACVEFRADIGTVHPFWKLAYLAYRIGYTTMFGQDALRLRYMADLDEVRAVFPSNSKA